MENPAKLTPQCSFGIMEIQKSRNIGNPREFYKAQYKASGQGKNKKGLLSIDHKL